MARRYHRVLAEKIAAMKRRIELGIATQEERAWIQQMDIPKPSKNPIAQELHNRDVAHNMTILLGIASAQQLDIKAIKEDLPVIKERIGHVESQIDMLTQQVDAQFATVNHRLDALIALITGSQGKQP